MEVTVRPMAAADVGGAQRVAKAAFDGLEASTGVPEPPPPSPEAARLRYDHPLATDPGGCWVGERHGQIVGVAIAIVREGLWGLSLLAVDPAHQSGGLGRELLARALGRGSVSLLAARDQESAAELLRAALADVGDEQVRVEWMTARQPWAVRVCREAGLRFHLGWGAVLTDGDVGPLQPYLPSGAYL